MRVQDFAKKSNGVLIKNQQGFELSLKIRSTTCNSHFIVRHNTSDVLALNQILILEEYFPIVSLIESFGHTSSIKTVVDVGANVGYATIYFGAFFPQALIVSVEPVLTNFDRMVQVLAHNTHLHSKPLHRALWDKDERLEIDSSFRDKLDWSRTVRPVQSLTTSTPITTGITINGVMDWANVKDIDLLKIDVEGAEQKLFSDKNFLAAMSKVKYLTMEIHDEIADRKMILSKLTELGFAYFISGESVTAFRCQ